MKNFKIITLNTPVDNEVMAWHCLEKGDVLLFNKLLQNGMPLTASMLTRMAFLNYGDAEIKKAITSATEISDNVFQWMRIYFELSELSDVLHVIEKQIPKGWLDQDEAVDFGLWNYLLDLGLFDVIAQNKPEILEPEVWRYNAALALLKVNFKKYAELVFTQGEYSAFLEVPDGWKYLVDNGKAAELLSWMRHEFFNSFRKEPLPLEEILEYCYKKGMIKEVAATYDGLHFLYRHKEYDFLKKEFPYYKPLIKEHPEMVDFEDLWQQAPNEDTKQKLLKIADKHRNLPNCRDFLWNHSGWFKKLLLLAY